MPNFKKTFILGVMRPLEENPELMLRESAEKLGISVGEFKYYLKALMEKGLVKMENFAHSESKLGYFCVLAFLGAVEKATITHRFMRRKLDKYEALNAWIEALKIEMPDDKKGCLVGDA